MALDNKAYEKSFMMQTGSPWNSLEDILKEFETLAPTGAFDAIHPVWWTLDDRSQIPMMIMGMTTYVSNPEWAKGLVPLSGAEKGSNDLNIKRIMDAAANNVSRVKLIPTVASANSASQRDALKEMISDPKNRDGSGDGKMNHHVENLVNVAVQFGYDGLDLNYEQLQYVVDPKMYKPSDALNFRLWFTQFVTLFASKMHSAGKLASISVGGIDIRVLPYRGFPLSVYDYEFLSRAGLDAIHVEAYDFHSAFSPHPGPTSPLGYVRGIIQNAVASGAPHLFIMGLANYGIVFDSPDTTMQEHTYFEGLNTLSSQNVDGVLPTTDHFDLINMAKSSSCSFVTDEVAAAYYDPQELAPHGTVGNYVAVFDDQNSLKQKLDEAAKALGGVTYWPFGKMWSGFHADRNSAFMNRKLPDD